MVRYPDKAKLKQQIAANIARVRRSRGITQEELAKRLGMRSVRRVVSYENDAPNLGLDTIERIASALGVDPSELLVDRRLIEQSKAALAAWGIEMLQEYLAAMEPSSDDHSKQ